MRRMTEIPEPPGDAPAAEPSSGDSLADQLSDILPYLKAQADATASIVRETMRLAERETSASAAIFAEIGIQLKQARTLRDIGWIPHPALPIQDFAGSETDPNALSPIVRQYVDDTRNWQPDSRNIISKKRSLIYARQLSKLIAYNYFR
jgi:hypothetical protein